MAEWLKISGKQAEIENHSDLRYYVITFFMQDLKNVTKLTHVNYQKSLILS
jgi:hypothetical protein